MGKGFQNLAIKYGREDKGVTGKGLTGQGLKKNFDNKAQGNIGMSMGGHVRNMNHSASGPHTSGNKSGSHKAAK